MFDNTNPYALRAEVREGITYYYISFTDGQAVRQEIEVSREMYFAIDECRKHEKRQQNFYERHIEHFDLTDEALFLRALAPPPSIEEALIEKELANALRVAIKKLPDIQRRRFILYHERGLTYEQIAEIEGCKKQSVCDSVRLAEKKVREKINNLED
jgi:RNA polymerase sigma-70 factor (ECF subfamily)